MEIRAISSKRRADFGNSEKIVLSGFFNERELEIFFELIKHRRQLPVFHGDFWRCYNCHVESTDLEQLAEHIMNSHNPTPLNVEDQLEQEFAEV